ncbi:MAG: hypothetical protein COW51_02155 [Candidatus Moranbacteria bacterium CG17_big_fil_post_rev_8_21_14_2_50_44_12]|nr:MAG: hypothetical protein COW51_02155 [Candidatus Moranbacteria bacterium CG17_big_fil_post_rev_8_21_14_2_50_44_12]
MKCSRKSRPSRENWPLLEIYLNLAKIRNPVIGKWAEKWPKWRKSFLSSETKRDLLPMKPRKPVLTKRIFSAMIRQVKQKSLFKKSFKKVT